MPSIKRKQVKLTPRTSNQQEEVADPSHNQDAEEECAPRGDE